MTGNHNPAPEPGLRCVRAPNPSAMTYWGTNTYILGAGKVAVIDPGPADPRHLKNIMAALSPGETIVAILVTHAHADHSGLSQALSTATQAPVYAFGDARAGQSASMAKWATLLDGSGGEGFDASFAPDEVLGDGETLELGELTIKGIWTPGHFGNHMCFAWQDTVFTGDLIMGWASTVVSPPYGDLSAYLRSVTQMAERKDRVYYPGHGAAIHAPQDRARWLIEHRHHRNEQILGVLDQGAADCETITRAVYQDVDATLLPAAQRNVLAHLIDLLEKNEVSLDFDGSSPDQKPGEKRSAIFVKK